MCALLISLPDFSSPEIWMSLLTLTFLEIVLGVDNIIFISIAANKLPKDQQGRARNIGLILAMGFRIILLFGISYLIAMQAPLWHFESGFFQSAFTGQSLILMAGGIFLIYKATSEIHHKLEGSEDQDTVRVPKDKLTIGNVIVQIALINVVFSFDSILTAVGLTSSVFIMIVAVVVSVVIMMVFAGAVGTFVNKHAQNLFATERSPRFPRAIGGGLHARPIPTLALSFDMRWKLDGDDRSARFGGGGELFLRAGRSLGIPIRAGGLRDNATDATYVSGGLGLAGLRWGLDVAARRQVAGGDETLVMASMRFYGPRMAAPVVGGVE
jgi:predicted tellurium resistance membrane protein TerC